MQAFRFRGFGVQGSGTWVYLRVRVSLGVLGFAVQSLGVLDFCGLLGLCDFGVFGVWDSGLTVN